MRGAGCCLGALAEQLGDFRALSPGRAFEENRAGHDQQPDETEYRRHRQHSAKRPLEHPALPAQPRPSAALSFGDAPTIAWPKALSRRTVSGAIASRNHAICRAKCLRQDVRRDLRTERGQLPIGTDILNGARDMSRGLRALAKNE